MCATLAFKCFFLVMWGACNSVPHLKKYYVLVDVSKAHTPGKRKRKD